jgi:hypothetical protein
MLNSAAMLLDQLAWIDGLDIGAVQMALEAVGRRELYVVVGGDFNNGKSTLINALVGRRLLLSSPVPTTGQTTYVRNGREERVVVRRQNGTETGYPLSCLEELTTLDPDGQAAQDVEQVTVYCTAPVLAGDLMLVDTPGTNDSAAQTQRALGAMETADVIVWVLRADIPLRQAERALADTWMTENPAVLVAPVVNFMPFVQANAQDGVRLRLTTMLERQFGPRLAWVVELTGKPFFEVDVQRALDLAAAIGGEPEADFVALTTWLRCLGNGAGKAVKAHSRAGYLETKLKRVREASRAELLQMREAAAAARQAWEEHCHLRAAELRHFRSRAEMQLRLVERQAEEALSERLDSLLDYWLMNETASSLNTKTNRWGQERLQEAVEVIVEAANLGLKTLAGEFAITASRARIKAQLFLVEFSVTMPTTGLWDDLRDLVGSSPTAEYMRKLRSRVRSAWNGRAVAIRTKLKRVWNEQAGKLKKKIEKRNDSMRGSDSDGWMWKVTDEFVSIKARELWLRRGAPVSTRNEEKTDWDRAKRILKHRLRGGEPQRRELLLLEMAEAALECVEKRYVHGPSAVTS